MQPSADRKAAGRRIGPGLCQHRDDPYVGLEGGEDAQRRLAVGLTEETQRIRVVVPGVFGQRLYIGGDFRLKIGPAPITALRRLKVDDAGDEDFLGGI